MKNYRFLVPVVLGILLALSWYKLISKSSGVETEYNKYVETARGYAENGITKYAMENYAEALKIKSTPEIYNEIVEYFNKQNDASNALKWSRLFFEEYPQDARAYTCLLTSYVDGQDYQSCYDIIEVADKRGVSSDYIEKVKDEIKFKYTMDFFTYDEVGVFGNNFCAVKTSDGYWGYVNRFGEVRIKMKFKEAGTFTSSSLAPVIDKKNELYFIDKSGEKVLAPSAKYVSFGPMVDNMTFGLREDGKYDYVNNKFEVIVENCDDVTTFNYGYAAIKQGDTWSIINLAGEVVSPEKYADVVYDEKRIMYRNERLFVKKTNGKYVMLDKEFNQVGKQEFDDAKVFAASEPTCVKVGDKWRYINKDGEFISDKEYENARPYSNGLAAVCFNELWGFMDQGESVVIEPQYRDAKDFNEKGSCFVMVGKKWQMLKIYRLNREG